MAKTVAQFSNVKHGVIMVFTVYQCRMLMTNLKDISLALDKRFYRGEVVFMAGFYDQQIVVY